MKLFSSISLGLSTGTKAKKWYFSDLVPVPKVNYEYLKNNFFLGICTAPKTLFLGLENLLGALSAWYYLQKNSNNLR
jgi:hypothetical protein